MSEPTFNVTIPKVVPIASGEINFIDFIDLVHRIAEVCGYDNEEIKQVVFDRPSAEQFLGIIARTAYTNPLLKCAEQLAACPENMVPRIQIDVSFVPKDPEAN